jgi:hypothetical protein
VLFDSGSDGFLEVLDRSVPEWIRNSGGVRIVREGYGATTMGINGIQDAARQLVLDIRELDIAGHTLDSIQAVTSSGVSRLGAGLFLLGRVTVDFAGKRFYFAPYPDKPRTVRERKWEIVGVPDNGTMKVTTIWNKELADASGIAVGDEILTINGRPAGEVTLCDMIKGGVFPEDGLLVMRIRTAGGAVREVTVRKS